MDAIELMISEHRLIERVLDSLEAYTCDPAEGGDLDADRLADHVRFLRGYADKIHHGKEEAILFAALRAQGCPELEPVLQAVQREHETGRNLVDDLDFVARRAPPWTKELRERLMRAASSFVSMLRRHIADEDDHVFPRAREVMSDRTRESVRAASEGFEAAHVGPKRDLEELAETLAAHRPPRL